ncbi:hypothetical protein [Leptospira levettii]|uniref:Rad50/SbcC-type AAA domain-containing protein n=1 Tax=Leptospira levettii TaxID=2023178 RepID=A0AAW5VG61_9LEPT|nr:hypothetical protein [Leptospira levettii]MCW7512127.1 hypothetical protein [Leptospira levettii]MCW7517273.1 hypothetical protein [Leptospira levettii]
MNEEEIRKISNTNLTQVRYFENKKLLFGKYVHNERTIGLYFIDYGEFKFTENIRDFQEKYISKIYYEYPGYEQWNFYLLLLRDVNSVSYNDRVKIEKDGVYTRKFVFSLEEYENYFKYNNSKSKFDSNIVNVWKERLTGVGLIEVFRNTSITKAVSNFIKGEVVEFSEEKIEMMKPTVNLSNLKIQNLKLKENFRTYPLERDFSFGRVNLITGVNGAGKTSFMEAIELVVTGKTARNSEIDEATESIEVIYDGGKIDIYTPEDNEKYRSRDLQWYLNSYKRGNELFKSFGKYNFFNADAGFSLSLNTNTEDLVKSLTNIALGSEFNQIQNRLNGFKKELSREKRVRKKELKEEVLRIKETKNSLANIILTTSPEECFQIFLDYALKISWIRRLPNSVYESFSEFISDYQMTQSLIKSIEKLQNEINISNLIHLENELLKYQEILNESIDCKNELEILQKKYYSIKDDLSTISNNIGMLQKALKYYENERSFDLDKFAEKKRGLIFNINKLNRLIDDYEKNFSKIIFEEKETFLQKKNEIIERIQLIKNSNNIISSKIENLKAQMNEYQRVISEIKTNGNRYLYLNINADSCPLCHTKYSHEELIRKVSKIEEAENYSSELFDLNGLFSEGLSKLQEYQLSLQVVDHMGNLLTQMGHYNFGEMNINEIKHLFEQSKLELNEFNIFLSEIIRYERELADKNLKVGEFIELKQVIEEIIPNFKFEWSSKSLFLNEIKNLENAYTAKSIELKNFEKIIESKNDTIRDLFNKAAMDLDNLNFANELRYHIDKIKKCISYYKELLSYLSLDNMENIFDTSKKIDQLFILYNNINEIIKSKNESKLFHQIITKAEKKINELQPVLDKILNALDTIEDILNNYNVSVALKDFLENNKEEIQEIFSRIHSPKEFSSIEFNNKSRTIELIRERDAKAVNVNAISTGQRSALALSIFIALNKKLINGPDVIMFDDPVAYTDDLNILSFLDYLRKMLIYEDKQIFFATANSKVANLFEKKFGFLGSGNFRKFQFNR